MQRGGPVDRPADQDRAVGPAAGDVRPQRRGAGAGDRPRSPGDCFDAAIEACRIALTYRTPVILLSDGYLANGAEPWAIPDVDDAARPDRAVDFADRAQRRGRRVPARTCATRRRSPARGRSRAPPGMQHRIGGLEKADRTGNISYDPANHDFMTRTRQAKVDGIAAEPAAHRGRRPGRRRDASPSSAGARPTGRSAPPAGGSAGSGRSVAQIHLRHINPMPADLGDILARYDRVVCPEMNLGQLALLLRAKYLVDVESHTQVRGLPFRAAELAAVSRTPSTRPTAPRWAPTPPEARNDQHRPRHARRRPHRRRDRALGRRPRARSRPSSRPRTSRPTRRCAGAPGAVTTSSSTRSRASCPASASPARTWSSSPGIGCSSRFPYYMNTYGMHSIHGRAPAIATGLAASRPDLSVWVVTGDGDALSIGGNHLIHALRRNVNLTILLFNNRIYGLTKGQYSPDLRGREGHQVHADGLASTHPFNPVSLALGADATFVGRAMDSDRKGLTDVLRQAAEHQGTVAGGDLPELQHLQRRRVRPAQGPDDRPDVDDPAGARRAAGLRSGRRLVRGADDFGGLRIAETNQVDAAEIVVHDAHRREPGLRVRAVPALQPGPPVHADGRLPVDRRSRPTTR